MRALITGGAGFVGRHFTNRLVTQGYDVLVVDNLAPGSGAIHPSSWPSVIDAREGDFRYLEQDCRQFFVESDESFDLVLHLAAIVGGRATIEWAPLAVAQDLSIDADFFNWAATRKDTKYLYFSSSAAYPIMLQTPENPHLLSEEMIDFEATIGVPDLSYGWGKLTGEYLSRLAHERYGLDVACYRPFSGYGEDQDLNYPFPSLIERVLQHQPGTPYVVWGSGEQSRDFIHIEDCVTMVLASAPSINDGTALNLSTGIKTTFRQLIAQIANVAGIPVPEIVSDLTKPEGVFCRVGATDRQRALGLAPTIPLDEGIARALAYRASLAR